MAYIKISELTDATAVNDTDELPIVQAGTTKRITVAEFMAAAPQPTTTIIEDASVSKRIAGVTVAWVSGLTFRVSAGSYKIQGVTYTVAQTDVTLGAADATNPRIDIIAVNTSGAAVVIAGTAAATPVKPDVDPDTQLELTFVDIAALGTEPAFASSNIDVYHEGTEWTDSKSGAPITLDSANNPLAGTKCIEATLAVTGNYFRFVNGADVDLGNYDNVVFNIRSKAAWASTRSINIVASKTGVQRGSAIAFREGSFGFDSSITTAYQQIVIPCSLFGAAGLSVDRFQFTVAGSGTGIGFYFDDMTLQGGTAIVSDDTKMQWRGEWNSNTLYNLNDVVKLSGVVYVALRASTNRTPATNTSDWEVVKESVATDPLWDAAGDLVYGTGANTGARLPIGTAAQVLTVNAGATAPEWATAAGGAGTKTYDVHTPMTSQPPAAAFATLDTRNSIAVLDFDATTDEATTWVGIIPEGAVLTSGLKIIIKWMATSATSGTCRWGAQIERMNTDLDADSFDTAATAAGTANGTSGILTSTEITITTIDSVVAGEPYRLKVYRDADGTSGTDDMTGDAELVAVEVRSAA